MCEAVLSHLYVKNATSSPLVSTVLRKTLKPFRTPEAIGVLLPLPMGEGTKPPLPLGEENKLLIHEVNLHL